MNITSIRFLTRPMLVATTILTAHTAFATHAAPMQMGIGANVAFHVKNLTTTTLTLTGSNVAGTWDRKPQPTVLPNATADWGASGPQNVMGSYTSGSVSYKIGDNPTSAAFTWDTKPKSWQAQMPDGYLAKVEASAGPGNPTLWTVTVTVTAKSAGPANGVTVLMDSSAMPNVEGVAGIEVAGPDLVTAPAAAEKVRQVVVTMPFTPVDLVGALGQIKAGAKRTLTITLFDATGHPTSRFKLNGCVPVQVRIPNLNVHDHRSASLNLIFNYQSVEVS